jgi:CheY-like chemotaxis protein
MLSINSGIHCFLHVRTSHVLPLQTSTTTSTMQSRQITSTSHNHIRLLDLVPVIMDVAPLSVLIVDDSRDTAETTAELLTMSGCRVRIALSGDDGLRIAKSEFPDVVLLDLRMPKTDGYEVARQLLANDKGKPPILVAVTGCSTEADREQTTKAGFHLHLVKPVDPALLIGLIRRIQRTLTPSGPPPNTPILPGPETERN